MRTLITLKIKDLVSFNTYYLIPVVNKNHYKCRIVTEYLFVLLTKLIVVSSLFKLKLITETYQWMLKLTTRPEHSLRNLQQYLGFNTTRKRFEPGHNLFTFLVVHSVPLKYNCFYHRNHISLEFFSFTS